MQAPNDGNKDASLPERNQFLDGRAEADIPPLHWNKLLPSLSLAHNTLEQVFCLHYLLQLAHSVFDDVNDMLNLTSVQSEMMWCKKI